MINKITAAGELICNLNHCLRVSDNVARLMIGAFGFYAGLCLLGWIFTLLCYPETAGLSLEEVTQIFKSDYGIKAAERLRAEKAMVMAPEGKSRRRTSSRSLLISSLQLRDLHHTYALSPYEDASLSDSYLMGYTKEQRTPCPPRAIICSGFAFPL